MFLPVVSQHAVDFIRLQRHVELSNQVTESCGVVQSGYRVMLSCPIRLQSHVELSNQVTESCCCPIGSLVVCFRQSAQPVARGSTTAIPTSPAPWTQRTSGASSRTVETSSSACTSDSTSSCDWSWRISHSHIIDQSGNRLEHSS